MIKQLPPCYLCISPKQSWHYHRLKHQLITFIAFSCPLLALMVRFLSLSLSLPVSASLSPSASLSLFLSPSLSLSLFSLITRSCMFWQTDHELVNCRSSKPQIWIKEVVFTQVKIKLNGISEWSCSNPKFVSKFTGLFFMNCLHSCLPK